MTIDEGYIKYASDWTGGPSPEQADTDLLNRWRRPLFDAGLIGHYADLGVGFGNISIRSARDGRFIISGTQTGHIAETGGEHYSLVTDYDIAGNRVSCSGPVEASSESLTHAAIYDLDQNINAVVHVHSRPLWNKLLHQVPTTAADIAYGTPEMAQEFIRLYEDTDFASGGIAAMAGHEEGIVSIGTSLEEAAGRVLLIDRQAD